MKISGHFQAAGLLAGLLLSGCGPGVPFEYSYRSPTEVDITMTGQTYTIRKGEAPQRNLPFTYEFEPDGDVDIVVNGVQYEVESPYDIDFKKKKKIKKSVNKTAVKNTKK